MPTSDQEVIFLVGPGPMSSPMMAKGVGEGGICGVGAAVANAAYNATGVRVADRAVNLVDQAEATCRRTAYYVILVRMLKVRAGDRPSHRRCWGCRRYRRADPSVA